tara:strand:- start:65 stop:244 length:180 start_codon:yes stop_codon:yes gene_type:complete
MGQKLAMLKDRSAEGGGGGVTACAVLLVVVVVLLPLLPLGRGKFCRCSDNGAQRWIGIE